MGKTMGNRRKRGAWKNKRNAHTRADAGRRTQEYRKNLLPKVTLYEKEVGITEFVTEGPGFTGVVKSRFSDFHVNEIDLEGKILQLNDEKIPQVEEESLTTDKVESLRTELKEIIKPDVWTKIAALAAAKSTGTDDESIEIEVDDVAKDQRTQIHNILKKLYAGKLNSTTVNEVGDSIHKKLIKISKVKQGRGDNRYRWLFPGEYVHFLVYKENMDTSEVASHMAERMNLRPSQVNYCGIKDRRAKTTQKFCIKKRTPVQIAGSVKALHKVHVGNFEFSNSVLKLGDLKGNKFRIALRHVSGDKPQIETALRAVREKGFINYFGLQRFGNSASVPTYEVGAALLKCDYKLACELILKPRDNDAPFMKAIRDAWWKDRNSAAAAAKIHGDKFIEKKLFNGLAQCGENDYSSALRKIPRNILMLYPHAFQSLVFNCVASRRIKEFGLKPIPGDLVYRNKDELDTDIIEEVAAETEECDDIDELIKKTEIENDDTTAVPETESIFKRKVKPLTTEDIASGNYTLFDVVLPLPGFDITYPDNVVRDWYEETLKEKGLSSANLRHNVKVLALTGTYRKLLIQPSDLTWKFSQYDSAESTLIPSDWELLKGTEEASTKGNSEGNFTALILEFSLPTSAYATMLLRELLKTDTSAASQTQLENNELKKVADKESVNVTKNEEKSTPMVKKRKAENIDNGSSIEDNNGDKECSPLAKKREAENTEEDKEKEKESEPVDGNKEKDEITNNSAAPNKDEKIAVESTPMAEKVKDEIVEQNKINDIEMEAAVPLADLEKTPIEK